MMKQLCQALVVIFFAGWFVNGSAVQAAAIADKNLEAAIRAVLHEPKAELTDEKLANVYVLEADGKHLMSDVLTSIGVVLGLGLVLLTRIEWLDSVLAIAVGLNIVWTGSELILRSFNGLMDHALSPVDQELIRSVIRANLPAGAEFHAVRTRQAGARRFVEFHLLVHGDLNVREAHHLAHRIDAALVEALPGLEVVIHVEPVDESESWEPEMLKQLGEDGVAAGGAP